MLILTGVDPPTAVDREGAVDTSMTWGEGGLSIDQAPAGTGGVWVMTGHESLQMGPGMKKVGYH